MHTIKILIGYHKPMPLFKSDILFPIQGGRNCTSGTKDGKLDKLDYKWLLNNCIGDNTGDNISSKNRILNEMTCIYWAWKNYNKLGNPDYIGFMQYGKHLIFNQYMEISKEEYIKDSETYLYPFDKYIHENNLSSNIIKDSIEGFDCLCSEAFDGKSLDKDIKNCKDCLEFIVPCNKSKSVFDLMCKTVQTNFPDYEKVLKKIEKDSIYYAFNLFVMKKEIFFEYCNFIFTVLENILKKIKLEKASVWEKRLPAFCSEYLTSMFIMQLENRKQIKIKYCKVAVINFNNTAKEALDDKTSLLMKDVIQRRKNRLKYYKYKLLSKITFGKVRKKYKQKKKMLKDRLKAVDRFLKGK